MVWFKKDKNKDNKDKRGVEGSGVKSPKGQTSNAGISKGQRPDSASIRAEALANARAARERLGEETIQKIAAALQKKQNSPTEQAKAKISKMIEDDAMRAAEEILGMLETRH
jgi:hypothetical protein